MTISELLRGLDVKKSRGPLDIEIKGIAYDSRLVKYGFLFVAVRGFAADGHDYINDAISRGAVAIVTDEAAGINITEQLLSHNELTHITASESRRALALLSAAFYGYPSSSLSLIGITGTNGKTTTSYITKSILDAWGKNTGLLGTIQYIIGGRSIDSPRTTPESLDVQRYLREMLDNNADYAVLEVSSHALMLDRVEGCSFKVAAFTNFSQDHLDFHETMEEYFSAKRKLFSHLSEDGSAVLNIDDPMLSRLARELSCNVITCGLEEGAMIRAENINVQKGLSFDVCTPEGRFRVESEFIGGFNLYNLLIAIGIAHSLGIKEEIIQKGISKARPASGRFESIAEGQEFLCIVDYAHTEDALRKVIVEARKITSGRVITVFGCGGDRDRGKRPLMGAAASELSDAVIVTSDNPRTEEPMGIIREILQGIKRDNYTVQPDRAEAIREAVAMAKEGDTVLVAGKGHEDYQEIQGVRYTFSDKDVL
ncbi:MAG: UDP-N-acetylmuramoyl-L-alanyl-D-glutamate--2,6-diaminopimelate ligase, partial [Nitrospirota bacterium]